MTNADDFDPPSTEEVAPYRLVDRVRSLLTASPLPVYLGVGACIAGFVLIAVTWAQVAPETDVALQLPYIVSAGFTGVALVMVGLTVISVTARWRDAAAREEQNRLLAQALHEVAQAVANPPAKPTRARKAK